MYHFKETEGALEALALDECVELSGNTVRYLKDFQLSAVRFLYNRMQKREFCILNDDSGLGKTATAAVLLGIVSMNKKCLVVASKDDRITHWRFHFNVLTDLNVIVIDKEKEYDVNSTSSVFILKWNTLRVIDDISRMSFDIVVLDNMDKMLNNPFCVSTLLKHFEKKVQLIISSVDITSDVKLMHNVLRLGGRLEHQLKNFKDFEKKFNLPNINEISTKKADLEDYFVKREILNDYCRDFRLRRYRYQYETYLPLVDSAVYKAHLAQWNEKVSVQNKASTTFRNISALSESMKTEEVLQQFGDKVNNNQEQLHVEVSKITNCIENDEENSYENKKIETSNETIDDDINMSPLVYLSETSDSDAEVVILPNNNTETVIPIIEIKDDNGRNGNDVQVCVSEEPNDTTINGELINHQNKSISEECNKNNQEKKDSLEKVSKHEKEAIGKSGKVKQEKRGNEKKRKTIEFHNEGRITRLKSQRDKVPDIEDGKNETPSKRGSKKLKIRTNEGNPIKRLGNSETEVVAKKQESALKKGTNKKEINDKTTRKLCNSKVEVIKKKKSEYASLTNEKKINDNSNTKTNKKTSPNQLNLENNAYVENYKSVCERDVAVENTRKVVSRPKSQSRKSQKFKKPRIHQRVTRNMQRITRALSNKLKCFPLKLNAEKKRNLRPTLTKRSRLQLVGSEKDNKEAKNFRSKQRSNMVEQHTEIKKKKLQNKSVDEDKFSLPSTQGSSIISRLSDFEDLQCGQKLIFDSSGDNSSRVFEKPNDFLMPSIPPSMRISNYPLLQQQHGTKSFTLFESNTDIGIVSNNNKNMLETIILLSSSHDEASSGDCNKQENISVSGKKKRKRKRKLYTNQKKNEMPSSFGNAMSNEKELSKIKSPDLFSVSSDIISSNAIPFTQIHCSPVLGSGSGPDPGPATTSSFGFKIFGSELRRMSVSSSLENSLPKSQSNRSCLNILDDMFEKRNFIANSNRKMFDPKNAKKKVDMDKTEQPVSTNALVTRRKSIHESKKLTIQDDPNLNSDNTFEITNNTTFGSTMRINATGSVSPVQQMSTTIQHFNKITNYLIGNGNVKYINNTNDEHQLLSTPINQRPEMTQQFASGSGSVSGKRNCSGTTTTIPYIKKSPKSLKQTQTTKLTKWFRRSSFDDEFNAGKEILKDSQAKQTKKRRRLDLSFPS